MGPNYVWALRSLFDIIVNLTGKEEIKNTVIDIERDMLKIREQYALVQRKNSLMIKYPEIANEWNIEKNGILTPDMFFPRSEEKVWWKCSKGHEWEAVIYSRVDGSGCPYCSGRRAITGETDLATLRPDLIREWDFEKNNISPNDCTVGTSKVVWWKCSKGHKWEASIYDRSSKGNGCPFCSGKRVLFGFNDLQTLNPSLAKEWNYEKNGDLLPSGFTVSSGRKVWWKCSKGLEWQSVIANRSGSGNNCPVCSGKRVLIGYNDLATKAPELAIEWNYEKNHGVKPTEYTVASGKRVWWKCSVGHEWQSIISNRTLHGRGCPYCAGQRVITGVNDLLSINPDLAREWNYEKNGELTPSDVTSSSNKKIWWKCSVGHEWQTSLNSRARGSGCPYCTGQKVLAGFNDLQTRFPSIAEEWNNEKNIDIRPTDVTSGSNRKVWWKCTKGHEWQTTIVNRTSRGGKCPYCSNRTSKRVICVETGKKYNSISEARSQTGAKNISTCCKNVNSTTGGFHWRYVD